MSYCNYGFNTNDDASVDDFMTCMPSKIMVIPHVDDSDNQEMLIDMLPETGIVALEKFEATLGETPIETEAHEISIDDDDDDDNGDKKRIDLEDLTTRESFAALKNEPTLAKKKPQRSDAILCSRRSLFVLSTLLTCSLVVLITALILSSSQSKEPTFLPFKNNFDGESSVVENVSSLLVLLEEETATLPSSTLLLEGEICQDNDSCESGLCVGVAPPYTCLPKVSGCDYCNDDRNCLSGKCVRRSGKSVCASTEDGKMDTDCFCDLDEQCSSNRCEGEFPLYKCKESTTNCVSDRDCLTGTCNSGQCSEESMGSLGNRQPNGDRCSGNVDCSSRICVGYSLETDGVCSDGSIGSICEGSTDCDSSRCIGGLCHAQQVEGASCQRNDECLSGICIEISSFNSGLCLNTSPENACNEEGKTCGDQNGTCFGGFCLSFRLASGAVCTQNTDCLSGDCSWSETSAGSRCA